MASNRPLALVLSGGGARGAYQAGVLHYMRTRLPAPHRHATFPILCGSSVGAINICFMAATAHDPDLQGRQMAALWRGLKPETIYLRNTRAFGRFALSSLYGMVRNLIKPGYFRDNGRKLPHFSSLLDTKPLAKFLGETIDWGRIHANVKHGVIQDVSLVATRMRTGSPEIFLQRGAPPFLKSEFPVHRVNLGPEHALASAAVPLVFSTVFVGEHAYVDGSVRLNTPLSPAIQLGARKIFTINPYTPVAPDEPAVPCPETECPPTLGEHAGKILNAFFQDRVKYDIEQLERINRLIEAGEKAFGPDYVERVNKVLQKGSRLERIELLNLSPSTPISQVFADWLNSGGGQARRLSRMERFLMRLLDVQPDLSRDLLSHLTFEGSYLSRLIDLGFEDARKNEDKLTAFLGK